MGLIGFREKTTFPVWYLYLFVTKYKHFHYLVIISQSILSIFTKVLSIPTNNLLNFTKNAGHTFEPRIVKLCVKCSYFAILGILKAKRVPDTAWQPEPPPNQTSAYFLISSGGAAASVTELFVFIVPMLYMLTIVLCYWILSSLPKWTLVRTCLSVLSCIHVQL